MYIRVHPLLKYIEACIMDFENLANTRGLLPYEYRIYGHLVETRVGAGCK